MESSWVYYIYKNIQRLIGIITAFNFPAAVFGWNMALGLVCGNLLCWKGAPSTNLVTIACTNIIVDVLRKNNVLNQNNS